jgi:L-seryl-tRNA(Ser) seleniumtransferase
MRSRFDQALRVSGARLVEIGVPRSAELWELESALSARTAAICYIAENEYLMPLPLETIVRVAHQHDTPVIVDAAAEIPPLENLWSYTRRGADLAIFSGGKDIRGPQSTGLIVGSQRLIEACQFHASPNYAVGRGMKVGKEEVMGFVTALELYLAQDFGQEMARWEAQVAYIVDSLSTLPGVTARRVYPGEPGIQPIWIPRAYINWTPAVTSSNPEELKDKLMQGEPRVAVGTSATGLVVNPQMLAAGQEQIVAACIKRALFKPAV